MATTKEKTTVKKTSSTEAKPTEKPAAKPKAAPKAKTTATPKPKAPSKKATKSTLSPEQRYKMIEVAAYYIAEKDGFSGNPSDYWAQAEAQISSITA